MSHTLYYLAWLAAGLVVAALASAAITRQLRLRVTRRLRAAQLLDALARYSGWIAEQQRVYFFEGSAQGEEAAVHEVRAIQREWFPELADDVAQLLDIHARLIDFLWSQQALRLRDAEAWLESDHDARFARLWQAHRAAAETVAERLDVATAASPRVGADTASPA